MTLSTGSGFCSSGTSFLLLHLDTPVSVAPPPSLGRLVLCEPLEVVAQHSFGLEGLAAAAGVRPLTGVVQLVDAQQ